MISLQSTVFCIILITVSSYLVSGFLSHGHSTRKIYSPFVHTRQHDDAWSAAASTSSNHHHHEISNKFVPLPLQRKFKDNGGILYKTGLFNKQELLKIRQDVKTIRLNDETSHTVARNRKGAILSPTSQTVKILKEGSLKTVVHNILGPAYQLSKDIPVEVRVYEKVGAGMDWHVDDVLYGSSPQLEVVVCLDNSSNCQTMWKSLNGEIKTVETDPNSALFLEAGGVSHCVSSLKRGKRTILKCAYVHLDSIFRPDEMVRQFEVAKRKRRR